MNEGIPNWLSILLIIMGVLSGCGTSPVARSREDWSARLGDRQETTAQQKEKDVKRLAELRTEYQRLLAAGDAEALRQFKRSLDSRARSLSSALSIGGSEYELRREIAADEYQQLQAALGQVKMNMTVAEVEKLCGPPDNSSYTESIYGTTLFYHYGSRMLYFRNGRLVSLRWN